MYKVSVSSRSVAAADISWILHASPRGGGSRSEESRGVHALVAPSCWTSL